ncbi:MAG: glycosyltransferase [Terricaulis sp.]
MRRAMLGLGLSRYLPTALRPHVIDAVTSARRVLNDVLDARDLAAKRKPAPRAFRGDRVALLGFADAPSGLGRGVRLMHLQMRNDGRESALFDIAPALTRDRHGIRALNAALTAFAPSDLIIHVNPPSFRDVVRRLPRALVLECGLIGFWAWELEWLPDAWRADAALCDEVWGPSAFVADAVRASLPNFSGAVRAATHAVDLAPVPAATPDTRQAARRRLGVEADAFVVGYAFTVASNFARKNPLAAIEAFQRAFPERGGGERLLLRCPDADLYPRGQALLAACAALDPRIVLLDRDRAPMPEFYHALDVFLSLHRSEGYGLQIAEALQAGAAAVATQWSLSEEITARARFHGVDSTLVDIEDPQHVYVVVAGARWASPDIDQAAEILAELRQSAASHPQ